MSKGKVLKKAGDNTKKVVAHPASAAPAKKGRMCGVFPNLLKWLFFC